MVEVEEVAEVVEEEELEEDHQHHLISMSLNNLPNKHKM